MRRRHSSASYRDAVLVTNPVGYWRLGEAAGTVARNEMGPVGAHVGAPTLGVLGLLAGDPDAAVTFNGTTQYMDTALYGVFDVNHPYTMLTWASFTPDAIFRTLMGTIYADGGGTQGAAMYIQNTAVGAYRYLNGVADDSYVGLVVAAGKHLMVSTYDGITLTMYVDGVSANAVASPKTLLSLSAQAFVGRSGTATTAMPGTYDDPAIWNRALTAAEIAALYAVGMGR